MLPEEAKPFFRDKLITRFRDVDEHLDDKSYLMGSDLTVADGYLFVVARWARAIDLDLSEFANLTRFVQRMRTRPAVRLALEAERQGG